MKQEPTITVGIVDGQTELTGRLDGNFRGERSGLLSGRFSAKVDAGTIVLRDGSDRELIRAPLIKLAAADNSTFRLPNVTIGNRFHWERTEDQTFQGDLILRLCEDGTITAINEIPLEDYLTSVISSEMNGAAPDGISEGPRHPVPKLASGGARSKERSKERPPVRHGRAHEKEGEVIRWYDREDHDLFDVCADDHCQRYQGITKIVSEQAEEAVRETRGRVITYQGEICDARYSKACGGLTEEFGTAWDDKRVPYLGSISDASVPHHPIRTEEEAQRWILSDPEAYCNTKDERLLEKILPEFDRETKKFFPLDGRIFPGRAGRDPARKIGF